MRRDATTISGRNISNTSATSGAASDALFWSVGVSSSGFIAILAISAYWDRSIAWLHLAQALQYVAIIYLAARRSRFGYLLGIAVAGFWNYVTVFVNNFVSSGVRALRDSLESGVLTRPDQMIAVFAFAFHLILIGTCVAAYLRLPRHPVSDGWRLIAAGTAAIAYMALIIAVLQPRYLSIFPRLLHPHAPF